MPYTVLATNLVMIIDAHAHACGNYFDEKKILETLEKQNIDMVVLCPGEANSRRNYFYPMLCNMTKGEDICHEVNKFIKVAIEAINMAEHTQNENARIYELVKLHPQKIIQAYWVNPLNKNCINRLDEDYKKYKFKMIKMHQCWDDIDILSLKVKYIFDYCREKNLPVFIHLKSKEQVEKFIGLSNEYLDVTVIIAHMIGFKQIHRNTINKNIYYDISSPQLIKEELFKEALDTVGSSKIIFGSDIPYGTNNIKINIARVNKYCKNINDKKNIMYENIFRILKKVEN